MVSKEFSKMSPGEQSLAELFRFWRKNGVHELLPGDVQMYRNWGFAIRNGQIAPVMLDAGFSKSVGMRYY